MNAELELLAAACFFFQRLGIGPDIVGIKINSRAVLEAVLAKHNIKQGQKDQDGGDIFAKACIIIDKLDKNGPEAVSEELGEMGVSPESVADILKPLQVPTVDALTEYIGAGSSFESSVDEIRLLFQLARDYGISDYLLFDASVVRGLAYYTGRRPLIDVVNYELLWVVGVMIDCSSCTEVINVKFPALVSALETVSSWSFSRNSTIYQISRDLVWIMSCARSAQICMDLRPRYPQDCELVDALSI